MGISMNLVITFAIHLGLAILYYTIFQLTRPLKDEAIESVMNSSEPKI